MLNSYNFLQELKFLSSDNVFRISKIERWLLKHNDAFKRIKEEESKRFMHLIDGNWVRLPDYFDARTPEEKFLEIYDALIDILELHRNEEYFKKEIAIYDGIRNKPEEIFLWLTNNEEIYLNKYYMFSMDYFGDEDEMKNNINLKLRLGRDLDRVLFINRSDFISTIVFTNVFNELYWNFLEDHNISKLN